MSLAPFAQGFFLSFVHQTLFRITPGKTLDKTLRELGL